MKSPRILCRACVKNLPKISSPNHQKLRKKNFRKKVFSLNQKSHQSFAEMWEKLCITLSIYLLKKYKVLVRHSSKIRVNWQIFSRNSLEVSKESLHRIILSKTQKTLQRFLVWNFPNISPILQGSLEKFCRNCYQKLKQNLLKISAELWSKFHSAEVSSETIFTMSSVEDELLQRDNLNFIIIWFY